MTSAERPWSVRVALHEVPETGRRINMSADEGARASIAKIAGLSALPRFEAQFDLSRYGRDSLRVVGRVSATVGQDCVVTLEPVESEFNEEVDLLFTPGAGASGQSEADEIEVPPDDGPEPLVGGVVDLGVLATDFLLLGIDPYPRKLGALFEAPQVGDDSGHPFEALAALKKGRS